MTDAEAGAEAATEDVTEQLRAALNTCAVRHDFEAEADWDETPQYVSCACGEVFEAEVVGRAHVAWHAHVIDEQVKAALLAGGVPGRSEAEIKAEAWDEGHAIGAFDAANLAIWNRPPMPNPYRAARVAGTTEAGDE